MHLTGYMHFSKLVIWQCIIQRTNVNVLVEVSIKHQSIINRLNYISSLHRLRGSGWNAECRMRNEANVSNTERCCGIRSAKWNIKHGMRNGFKNTHLLRLNRLKLRCNSIKTRQIAWFSELQLVTLRRVQLVYWCVFSTSFRIIYVSPHISFRNTISYFKRLHSAFHFPHLNPTPTRVRYGAPSR